MNVLSTRKAVEESVEKEQAKINLGIKGVKEHLVKLGVSPQSILRVWFNSNPGTRHDNKFFIEVEGLREILIADADITFFRGRVRVSRVYYVGSEYLARYYFEVTIKSLSDFKHIVS